MVTYCDTEDCVHNHEGECNCVEITIYQCRCDEYDQKLSDQDPKDVIKEILNRMDDQREANILRAILFNDIDNVIDWDLASKTIVKQLS